MTRTIRSGAAALLALAIAACATQKSPSATDSAGGRATQTGGTAHGDVDLSLAEGGPHAFVTNEVGDDVSVIDARSGRTVATLDAGKRPRGIRLMPDGRTLVVAVSGSPRGGPGVDESKLPPADHSKDGIALVDLATREVRRLPGGIDPENFDITPDGRAIYVANEDASAVSVVDVASGAVVRTIPVGGEPEGVTVRPGGDEVWVTSEEGGQLYVIDTKSGAVAHRIAVGKRPRSVVFTHDGKRAWAPGEVGGNVTVIDATTYMPVTTITVPGKGARPMGTAIAPDDSKVYVSTGRGGTVAVLDTKTNRFVGTIAVGTRPWGMAITPDGRELWTANGPPGNDVSVVDLTTGRVVRRVAVGDAPWGVALSR